MDIPRWDQSFRRKFDRVLKTLHSRWKKKIACPVGLMDDSTIHISESATRRRITLANLGTEGERKVTIEGVENTEG